VATIGVL